MSTYTSVKYRLPLTCYRPCGNHISLAVLVLLYGRTTKTQMKRLEKKLEGYTKMLPAVLDKSWKEHPTKQQLYGRISENIKVRRRRHAVLVKLGRTHNPSDSMDSYTWTPHADQQKNCIHHFSADTERREWGKICIFGFFRSIQRSAITDIAVIGDYTIKRMNPHRFVIINKKVKDSLDCFDCR